MIHIIDDDYIFREVMVEIIQGFGYSTKDFCSGNSYLHYMEQGKYLQPKGIFSDMNMPGISGLAMLRKVLCCYPAIPCYIITGDPTQFSELNFSDYAIRDILGKPLCPRKIESILQSLHQS